MNSSSRWVVTFVSFHSSSPLISGTWEPKPTARPTGRPTDLSRHHASRASRDGRTRPVRVSSRGLDRFNPVDRIKSCQLSVSGRKLVNHGEDRGKLGFSRPVLRKAGADLWMRGGSTRITAASMRPHRELLDVGRRWPKPAAAQSFAKAHEDPESRSRC